MTYIYIYRYHRVAEPTLQKPDVATKLLEMHACWASKRRAEPRIGENCTARRDECNGGGENARNSSEILAFVSQRQAFAETVPPPDEILVKCSQRQAFAKAVPPPYKLYIIYGYLRVFSMVFNGI